MGLQMTCLAVVLWTIYAAQNSSSWQTFWNTNRSSLRGLWVPRRRRTRSAGIISETGVQQWTVPVNTLPYLTLHTLPYLTLHFLWRPLVPRSVSSMPMREQHLRGLANFDCKKNSYCIVQFENPIVQIIQSDPKEIVSKSSSSSSEKVR